MSQLDEALRSLQAHRGVRHVLILGSDGLLIQHTGEAGLDAETVSAMVPGIAQAASGLGGAAGAGQAATVVVQLTGGVAVVATLSAELLLAVLLDAGVGFAPLLRDLAARRGQLASFI